MIARVFAVLAATAAPAPGRNDGGQCNSGYVACRNSVQEANSVDKKLAFSSASLASMSGPSRVS
ncbi:hypothetical protein H1R20_g2677, partial [Candolleomyces eurysporus]